MGNKQEDRQPSGGTDKGKSQKFVTEEEVYAIVQTLMLDSAQVIRLKSGWIQSGNYANNTRGWKQDANGNAEFTVISLVNLAANPAGPNEAGDICCVLTKVKVCTVAGTPGTWVVVGTQT